MAEPDPPTMRLPNGWQPIWYLTYVLSNARNQPMMLPTPDEFATLGTAGTTRCAP